jgi:arginine decarboxylase
VQPTRKTLTSLRQGSMIHVFDQDFSQKAEETFHEAYMAHTSTSPNYQILASLDLGRRQADLEGFELVQSRSRTRCGCAAPWTATPCCPGTCAA